MSNETQQKHCACGEPAMSGFDSCATCYQHPQLIAAIERRVQHRLLRALNVASQSLPKEHDDMRAALAVLAFGLGADAADLMTAKPERPATLDDVARRAVQRAVDEDRELQRQLGPRGFYADPLCLMCNHHHPVAGPCPEDGAS